MVTHLRQGPTTWSKLKHLLFQYVKKKKKKFKSTNIQVIIANLDLKSQQTVKTKVIPWISNGISGYFCGLGIHLTLESWSEHVNFLT